MQLSPMLPEFLPGHWLKRLLRDKNFYIGIALFILAAGLGYSVMLYSAFGDEGDSMVGLAAVLWSSIGFLYFSNMALYQSVVAMACLPLFVIPVLASLR